MNVQELTRALHPRFQFCPLCGDWVDIDEHTECLPVWRATDGLGAETVYAPTASEAACKYARLRDELLEGNGGSQVTAGGIVVVYVTDQINVVRRFMVVGQLVPVYTAVESGDSETT